MLSAEGAHALVSSAAGASWSTAEAVALNQYHLRIGQGRKTTSEDNPTAQDLLNFFNEKVDAVRRSTGGGSVQSSLPPTMKNFDTLIPVTIIKKIITCAPSKSCDLDPLTKNVLKEFLPELLPFLTEMCNKSLSQGCLPQSQRHAIVTPRLK